MLNTFYTDINSWTDGKKCILVHDLEILDYVKAQVNSDAAIVFGTIEDSCNLILGFPGRVATFFVVTSRKEDLIMFYAAHDLRPSLDLRFYTFDF